MKTLSRGLSLVALVAWGVLMLYFYYSGRLEKGYLIPEYRPLVAISGFVMLGIAAVLAWGMRPGARDAAAGLVLEDRGDELTSPRRVRLTQALAFALLVVPVWAAAAMTTNQYSADTMRNKGIIHDASQGNVKPTAALASAKANAPAGNPLPVAPPVAIPEQPLPGETPAANNPPSVASNDATQYLQKTPDGHLILEVTDLLFAAEDDALRPALTGQTAEMIGQFMPAKDDASGRRFQLVRMFMLCCAADARPVAIMVDKPADPKRRAETDKTPELGWVRVVGTVDFPLENGRRVAVLNAAKVTPTDPPREAMLY